MNSEEEVHNSRLDEILLSCEGGYGSESIGLTVR